MKVAITGAGGLVGAALAEHLSAESHEVIRLRRQAPKVDDPLSVSWDPGRGVLEPAKLEGLDGVVHLAGESIASGRWSQQRMDRIRDSRIEGTRLLVRSLAALERPPAVFLSASAVGYYGDRGSEILTEESAAGGGFLAEVVKGWEAEALGAESFGARVALARLGVVVTSAGGFLGKLLPPFKLGGGGVVGSGRQYLSWISLHDTVAAMMHLLETPDLSGPFNLCAPHPLTNHEMTKSLGRVLRRPTVMPLPAFAARAIFGRMADELLLASTRAQPQNLLAAGFEFTHPRFEETLHHYLARP